MRTTRTVALGATIGTLAALSRVPFAPLPNVQPATALVILAGAVLGPRVGVLAGVVVPLVSNAFLGHGPWTLFQAIGWGLVGGAASLLSDRASRFSLAAFGLVAGFVFGAITDGWVWLASVRPLTLRGLLGVLAAGLPFNTAHAVSNAVILWLVGPRVATLFRRARDQRRVLPFEEEAPATG